VSPIAQIGKDLCPQTPKQSIRSNACLNNWIRGAYNNKKLQLGFCFFFSWAFFWCVF